MPFGFVPRSYPQGTTEHVLAVVAFNVSSGDGEGGSTVGALSKGAGAGPASAGVGAGAM